VTVEIRGIRLTLRDLVAADEAAVHAYASDPVVTRFLVWGPNTAEDTRHFIGESIASSLNPDRTSFDLAVIHNDSQRLIGGAALRVTDIGNFEGEIGYVFGREFWSRGYATETAQTLLRFGFDRLALQRVCATCDAENHASARVLQKAGMTFEGRVLVAVRGSWRDSLRFTRVSDTETQVRFTQ
jgi:RimJ/RimL family protein N-acetyltransferase